MVATQYGIEKAETMKINKNSNDYKAGFKAGYLKAQNEMREEVNDFLRRETAKREEETARMNELIEANTLLQTESKGSC